MVLARRVGKKRSFLAGFLLSIVTALVYSIYWNYRAHDEVYRQFELEKEGRDEGVVWYVLGIILPPFLLAYWWIMVSNVAYVRGRMRLGRGVGPGVFLTLTTLAFAAYFGALVALLVATGGNAPNASLASLAAGLLVSCLALGGLAYARLQRDINEVWDAYDLRMMELRAPEAPPPAPPPAVAPWAAAEAAPPPSYYADLPPEREQP